MFLFEILWQPHPPLPHPHRHPRHRHPRHDHHDSPPPSHHPLLLLMIIMIIESQAGDTFVLAFQCPSVAISEPFGKSANHLQIGDNFRCINLSQLQPAKNPQKTSLLTCSKQGRKFCVLRRLLRGAPFWVAMPLPELIEIVPFSKEQLRSFQWKKAEIMVPGSKSSWAIYTILSSEKFIVFAGCVFGCFGVMG